MVSAVAAVIAAWQLREARRANAFPATVDLFREYRSREMVAARRLSTREKELEVAERIDALPDEIAQAVLQVSHYLDNIGVLVANKLIRVELVAGFLGDSALRQWRLLGGLIRSERLHRKPPAYMPYFEHLAVKLVEVDPAKVREELKEMERPAVVEPS